MNKSSTPTPAGNGAKNGDLVAVDYVGTLEDGKLFDTSVEAEALKAGLPPRAKYEPLTFTVGAGQMIKGFDAGVVGMRVGEEKTVKIPAAQAYGESDPLRIIVVEKAQFGPEADSIKVGMQVMTQEGYPGRVTQVNATHATIDFNHELAGKTLVFKITMRKIN